jgi:hypothetical protein
MSSQTATSGASVSDEYSKYLRARSEVGALKADDMFGDRIGLFTGSLEFVQKDVSIPGNNALEVAIQRKLRAGSQGASGLFAEWDLAIPTIHGVFSEQGGWKNWTTEPFNRCSKFKPPPEESVTVYNITQRFQNDEFWQGVFLYLPTSGDEDVLEVGTTGWMKPSNGYNYPLRTKSGAAIRCILAENGTEEAFEVVTPEGITYRLNHMASRMVPAVTKAVDPGGCCISGPIYFDLRRREYFLLPTLASDRFGNTVTYSWSSTEPWQLTQISSSDGRVLDVTTVTGPSSPRITQVRSGSLTWNYEYATGGLSKVILPDQTSWEFTPGLTTNSLGSGSTPTERSHCLSPGDPTYARSGTMKHPSGAVAIFSIAPTLHGRSWSTYNCDTVQGTSAFDRSSEQFPAKYYLWSLTKKQISGAGVPAPYVWTYTYGPDNGCYAGNELASRNCIESSLTTKWVDVKDPEGVITRYTFGNRFWVDEGYLLNISKPGQSITQSYELNGAGPYPLYAGWSIQPGKGLGYFASKMVPLREKKIEQDGMVFSWRANSYDVQARPISITRSSGPAP